MPLTFKTWHQGIGSNFVSTSSRYTHQSIFDAGPSRRARALMSWQVFSNYPIYLAFCMTSVYLQPSFASTALLKRSPGWGKIIMAASMQPTEKCIICHQWCTQNYYVYCKCKSAKHSLFTAVNLECEPSYDQQRRSCQWHAAHIHIATL